MKKLSLIIPVYNVEKYIGRCLDACLLQDLSENDYEIIIVNDGTPDNSMGIVESYAQKYPNIRIIERKNGGLSAARNSGLNAANGEYVWFIDSDDRIERNCLSSLLKTAQENRLDVLCFGLQLEYPNGRCERYAIHHDPEETIFAGGEFLEKVSMPPAAWAALYRREFLIAHSLRFLEGILHEDQEFTPRAYCLASKISYIDSPIYYYNQRDGGIMKSRQDAKRCRDMLTIADSLYDFANRRLQHDHSAAQIIIKNVHFCVTQSLAYYSDEIMSINCYKEKPYYPMDVSIHKGVMKWKIRLANYSLRWYNNLYSVLKR